MNKIVYALIIASFAFTLFGLVLVNYWLIFDSNPPIVFENPNNLTTDKSVYKLGETIYIIDAGCRYTDVPEKICWRLQDGISYDMDCFEIMGGTDGMCWEEGLGVGYQLPDHALPPGEYHIITKSEFKVNPIMTRYFRGETVSFTIEE